MFKDNHFVLQKNTDPESKQFGVQETCTDLFETVNLDNSVLANNFLKDVNGDCFAKAKKFKNYASLIIKEEQTRMTMAVPKSRSRCCRKVDLLELPIQTQDLISLCRAQSKIVW